MTAARKLAAILAADVVGYSWLAGADEERILARLRALRSDLIDPTIAVHHGRVVKRTGDGAIVEFRSAVDALRCAIEVQNAMVERNSGVPEDRRIVFRIGVHVGDVVEEADGDLMGDAVNIAARLEGIAEPGGIRLSEDAYRQVRDKVKETFEDVGETALKNIAHPVRVYAVKTEAPVPQTQAAAAPAPEKSGPPRLSIVVLPFANMGGDATQDYFVDGVTESLTTDLSRMRGVLVIGRNTAFTYKGRSIDLRQIGRNLNVRYVLEGSVQRGGSRIRVNVQLVDAETGNHLWADRFDKPLADLLDLQDEIVARLANALNAQLVTAEARRAERAPIPDSTDLYFQAVACMNRGWSPEYLAQARWYFDRALMLDPGNVEALVGLASVDAIVGGGFSTDDRAQRLMRAEAALSEALSLVPDHAAAHMFKGSVEIFTDRAAQGLAECELALALDRNLALAHGFIGLAKIFTGRAEECETAIQEALRLSPRDTYAFRWLTIAGAARIYLGREEEAVTWLRRAIDANRNFPLSHFFLAAALSHVGQHEDARMAAEAGLALDPKFTLARFLAGAPSSHPIYLAQRAHMLKGMRKAGVPEG